MTDTATQDDRSPIIEHLSARLRALESFEQEAERFQGVLGGLSVLDWPTLEAAFAEIGEVAAKALGVGRVSIWRFDDTHSSMRCAMLWQGGVADGGTLEISRDRTPHYWEALHRHRTLAIEDARTDPAMSDLVESYAVPNDVGALLDSGIRAKRETLGIVCVEHLGGPRHWTAPEREFVASIGERVGLAMMLDTERKLTASLEVAQRMEAIGLLAGGIAHDFNNILGVILGNADLALDGLAQGANVQEELQAIANAANHASGLTRKLLAIARKESLHPIEVDLNEVVRAFLPMAQSLGGSRVTVCTKLSALTLRVRADRVFLDQVLLNLVSNAAHAMPSGGTISLETAYAVGSGPEQSDAIDSVLAPVEGRFARLTVQDTGSGIARDQLSRIFDPFYSTKGERGTGLGLAVVYGGVRQHGGHISIESTLGVGTTFHVFLPIAE